MAVATSAGEAGSVMFAMWMPPPLQCGAAAITYVEPPAANAAIPAPAPGTSLLPDARIARDDDGAGEAGSVMLISWIAPSLGETATAYVPPRIVATATSMAPPSRSKPPRPSTASETCAGLYGSVMLVIRTPSGYHHTGYE